MNKKIQKKVYIAIFAGVASIQLIYALCWSFKNINCIQNFYDTSIYLESAISGAGDGWRLLGYSTIIRIFMQLDVLVGQKYIIFIYLFQVLCSLLCYAYGFLRITKVLYGKSVSFINALLISTYVITIPIIWQMQFAILPDALCMCLVVLLFTALTNILNINGKFVYGNILIVGGSLLLLGVLQYHYFYGALCLMLIAIIAYLVCIICRKNYKKINLWTILILMALIITCPLCTNAVNKTVPKSVTYATHSIEAEFLRRFVYPNLVENYAHYTERITCIIPEYVAEICDDNLEYYYNSIGPMIENNNPAEAEEIYFELARIGYALHKREIINEGVKEAVAYTLMPIAMEKYMYSNGDSLYGHNYSKMYNVAPRLSADYMHIGMNGFMLVCIIGGIIWILEAIKEKRITIIYCLKMAWGLVAIWCVTFPQMLFSVSKFDYRIGLFSVFIWSIFAVGNICGKRLKDDKCE